MVLSHTPDARAQLSQLTEIPVDLFPGTAHDLANRRLLLIQRGDALRSELAAHNQKCSSVEEGSRLVDECANNQARLIAEIHKYNADVDAFDDDAQRVFVEVCQAAPAQLRADREIVERQMHTTELSREELAEWNNLSSQAQVDAVAAGVRFVSKEFISDMDPVRGSVSKLERQAADLARKASNSRKYSTRLRYASQLSAVVAKLEPLQQDLVEKSIVQTGVDADKAWQLSRNTMKHEFRVARNQSEQIRDTLKDPEFKKAFTGDDAETPGLDVISLLADETAQETGKFLVGLDKYESFTGPAIRAAVFVRDASYDALLSYYSTQRALQQDELAGALATSAGALQKRYQKSVDLLKVCRTQR